MLLTIIHCLFTVKKQNIIVHVVSEEKKGAIDLRVPFKKIILCCAPLLHTRTDIVHCNVPVTNKQTTVQTSG